MCWNEQSKMEFFQEATAGLWTPDLLSAATTVMEFEDEDAVIRGCTFEKLTKAYLEQEYPHSEYSFIFSRFFNRNKQGLSFSWQKMFSNSM